MMSLLESVQMLPGYRRDHSLVKLSLNLNKIQMGKGYWKFNNSLLKDNEYIRQIKNVIKETIKMYLVDEIDADSICFETHNFENHKLIINDQLFFDTLLTMIRGETISYTAMRNSK